MFQALHDDSINEPSCDDSTGTSLVEIAERARAGDNSAFAVLFQYYNGQICTYEADTLEVPSITGPEEHEGEAECVKQALAALAPQCRTCLLLQVMVGFTQREIAEALGISEKSVSAYVSRGREQFRRAYHRLKGAIE